MKFIYEYAIIQHMQRSRVLSILLSLFLALAAFPIHGAENSSRYFTMENGMRIFLLRKTTLPIVNLSFGFDVGSKDESGDSSGMVHILEHCILFRGTKTRDSRRITREVREHGAYYNAHTGFDLSLFEMSLPAEYFDFALRNQRDILFDFEITAEALEAEKAVILEELRQRQDDPTTRASEIVFANLLKNSPYKNPISGRREVIAAAKVQDLRNFHQKYFIPSRCVLAVVGDIVLDDAEKRIREVFGDLESNKIVVDNSFSPAFPLEKDIEIEETMDVNQAYMIIGALGPTFDHEDQYALDVLVEILGHGVNPMLNQPLRGRLDLVRSIRMSFQALKYGGAVLIYLTLDPKNINAAKRETFRFLRDLRSMNFSPRDFHDERRIYAFDFLESAKNQIRFKSRLSNEKGLNISSSMAMYLLLTAKPFQVNYQELINKVSSSDLRTMASKYFGTSHYVIVSILPKEEEKTP